MANVAILDVDGTLVDTNYQHALACHRAFRQSDVRVPVWIPAKFVAKMQANTSGGPVLFRVEREAGHGIGSKRSQIRDEWADLFAFALWRSTTR